MPFTWSKHFESHCSMVGSHLTSVQNFLSAFLPHSKRWHWRKECNMKDRDRKQTKDKMVEGIWNPKGYYHLCKHLKSEQHRKWNQPCSIRKFRQKIRGQSPLGKRFPKNCTFVWVSQEGGMSLDYPCFLGPHPVLDKSELKKWNRLPQEIVSSLSLEVVKKLQWTG